MVRRDAGVVHDGINALQRRSLLPETLDRGRVAEVALDDGVAAALHGLPGRFRCRPVGVVMQHDRDATHCQRLADRCANAARGPGNEYVSHASRLRCVIPRTDAGAGRPPRSEYAATLGAAAMVCHARDEVIAWPLVDRAHRPHHTIRGHRPSPRTRPGPGLPQACRR